MSLLLAAANAELSPWGTLLFLAFVAASLIVWAAIIQRLAHGSPLIPFAPRRPVPWNWVMALGAIAFYLGFNIAAAKWIGHVAKIPLLDPRPRSSGDLILLMVATALAGSASTVVTLLALRAYCGATRSDLGLKTRWLGRDVLYGAAGFLAVTPVVFFIKWLLLPFSEENHPLEKLVREHPTPAVLFWTVTVAVIVAPWVEEFLLRVVFQGSLERYFFRGSTAGATESADEPGTTASTLSPESVPTGSDEALNPYVSPAVSNLPLAATSSTFRPLDESDANGTGEALDPNFWQAALPIVISSALFATLHIGHGIDPIPLFVLALALGWLYQRTHRLWPSVALHTALNATSVAMLFLSV